jgi:hypothetical protein
MSSSALLDSLRNPYFNLLCLCPWCDAVIARPKELLSYCEGFRQPEPMGYGTSALWPCARPCGISGKEPQVGASGCPATKVYRMRPAKLSASSGASRRNLDNHSYQFPDNPHTRYKILEPKPNSKSYDTHEPTTGSRYRNLPITQTPRAEQPWHTQKIITAS